MPSSRASVAVSRPIEASVINLLSLDQTATARLVQQLGWPRYRADQILRWLYQKRVRTVEEMTDLGQHDRRILQDRARIDRFQDCEMLTSTDGTRKLLTRLQDGLLVESVLIPGDEHRVARLTLCVSTQVGCLLDCTFCLTARMGLKRNLRAHEIVDQVLTAQDAVGRDERLTNIVLMGMGEPLANLEAVSDAVRRLTNPVWGVGIPARRITLSTAGLASQLQHVSALGINLAISLNATTEEQRRQLMPRANRLHSMKALLAACRQYPLPPRRKLTFEYVLLAGVNDAVEDAKRLVKLIQGIRCKVNLIPFNEFPDSGYRRPSDAKVLAFQAVLQEAGLDVFIRKSKGRDVLGACGQLGDIRRDQSLLTPLAGGR
jgi:23S rRNA (adenine2503-C2)-methyltransferase